MKTPKKTPEKKSRLADVKGLLSRDEMKKITGGYTVCPNAGFQCWGFVCQYPGQFIPWDFC